MKRTGRTKFDVEAFGDIAIDGQGAELVFKFSATRKLKTGRYVHYDLQVSACRWTVRKLAEQIKAMQDRDRARIAEETERLSREIAPLVKP